MLPLSLPSPPADWQAFTIPFLGVEIRTYALCIIAGIVAAVLIANFRLTRRGGEPWIIIDVAVWAVVIAIVCARLYHVFTHPGDYFFEGNDWLSLFQPGWNVFDPSTYVLNDGSIWAIWKGGNAIFGALIGGAIGVAISCRLNGLRFWSVVDAIAPGMLVAQALGRLGNYVNQELFGLPTDLPWGLEIDRPNPAIPVGLSDDTLFHPTFLYEMLWNLAGVAVILLIENQVRRNLATGRLQLIRRPEWQWGTVFGLYLVWYGIGRTWFESIRLDPSETFLGIRSNVWAALAALVLGLIIIIVQRRAHTGAEPSVYRPGKEWDPDAGVDSEDTYSESDEPEDSDRTVTAAAATSASSTGS